MSVETSTAPDALQNAVVATRLLGRWVMVGQRHGGGCSCCPPGIDMPMDEVERNIIASLRKSHPILEGRESVNGFLRDCVAREQPGTPEELGAVFKDLGEIIDDLEKIQLGIY